MDRRGFIKGLLGASAAAVAAEFGAPAWMGEEIRGELLQDLTRTQIQVPGQVFDNRPIWTSVSGVKDVWVEHAAKELARQIDRDILASLQPDIERSVKTLVRAVDTDLYKAEIATDQKIIMDLPKVRIIRPEGVKPVFELKAGLEKKEGLFGACEHRVGYLQEAIII